MVTNQVGPSLTTVEYADYTVRTLMVTNQVWSVPDHSGVC